MRSSCCCRMCVPDSRGPLRWVSELSCGTAWLLWQGHLQGCGSGVSSAGGKNFYNVSEKQRLF